MLNKLLILSVIDKLSFALDLFLNLVEILAIIVSVSTFFILMFNKYNKALKSILGPCGINFITRIRALFCCRKYQVKKRAFIEYAILKTGGYPVIKSEWNQIINSFKTFYNDANQGHLTYEIPNCTLFIDSEFSSVNKRYFDYFSIPNVHKFFGIQDDEIDWVIKIKIAEAYVTPTCLLTGLLSQYDENWEAFIKRYVSTAYITDNDETSQSVLSTELYMTFAWLLWGPSYEIEFKKYWSGLCQLSYGDESNSIAAIADTDTHVADDLRKKLLMNEERRYGALISADIVICEKKALYNKIQSNINPKNAYFYEKIVQGDISFGVKINNFTPCVNYKSKKYYSTAYVWILFELEDEGYVFNPEKSVAFFEHANLADKETYRFLIRTLIDKSLTHFEHIFSNPKFDNRKYRFVCGMNNQIANTCINEYKKIMDSNTSFGKKLKERVILDMKHSPSEVFAAYDEFFTPSKNLSFVEVSISDKSSINDLGEFYTNIYIDVFPDENERETFDNILLYLKKAGNSQDYKYHIVLAKDEAGKVVGGCIFDYFKNTNSAVIEFLAIRTDMQSSGVGTFIFKKVKNILLEDAFEVNKKQLEYIFCEIDSPEYSKANIKKYLYFWAKNNFKKLDFSYIQPALSENQDSVNGLWFIVSPQLNLESEIDKKTVLNVIKDYMKYAMSIENPENHKDFIKMKEEMITIDKIKYHNIIK